MARRTPSDWSTRASGSHKSGRGTPMSAAVGAAGFNSGPRKLKIVLWSRAAQSLRAGTICRKAGW